MYINSDKKEILLVTAVPPSFPQYYLHMDGRGNYEFKQITEDTVEFGS